MHSWMTDLFFLNRSLSGNGNRETLSYLNRIVPELRLGEIPSGENVFDWIVPDEWNVVDAFIETMQGQRFAEFSKNNLHLVGYSEAINRIVTKSELLSHLYFLPESPEAIPYVTSYYNRTWGFCISKQQFDLLGEGPFKVVIDSSFKSKTEGGSLSYGEIFLQGKSSQEVIFSTYICHPSMANNELSGPVIATALANHIKNFDHHYSYRILFLPETIGSIFFLSENIDHLKKNCIAGWVLTCIGDSGKFSYIPSRKGNNYADRITTKTLRKYHPDYISYSWLDRGSDERQWCSPGVDLPMCSITRSKYGTFPQYHTSLDDLNFVTAPELAKSFDLICKIVDEVERNRLPFATTFCEPQLGKRGLYPNLSTLDSYSIDVKQIMDVLSFSDGTMTADEIASACKIAREKVDTLLEKLSNMGLVQF